VAAAAPPSYVIVGHVTLDVVPGGVVPGGTATYAGKMARNLGERVGLVTSSGDDFDYASALPGIQVARVPASRTSTFENRYVGDRRHQYIRAVAEPLGADAVPAAWRVARIVHLAPLTNEVLPGVEDAFPAALRAATPQGWLRRWGPDGLVRHEGWESLVERLSRLDAVVLSEEDVQRDESTIDLLRRNVPLLVVTRGARGATLFRSGEGQHVPPFEVAEVEPTGAGDAFAAAFFIEMARSGDAMKACELASCAGSFVVQSPGADGVPTAEQVAERCRAAGRG
jgi:1D-myo-inositol 3-kinase